MGGCQNYGPVLGTLNNRCRTVLGTQKGTIILTTTHVRSVLPGPLLGTLRQVPLPGILRTTASTILIGPIVVSFWGFTFRIL